MITKFFTNQLESSPKITRVQVDRETETAVYFRRSPHVEIREPNRVLELRRRRTGAMGCATRGDE